MTEFYENIRALASKAAKEETLEGAVLMIQKHIGQFDGGVAAMFFCNTEEHYEDTWPSRDEDQRIELLEQYISTETVFCPIVRGQFKTSNCKLLGIDGPKDAFCDPLTSEDNPAHHIRSLDGTVKVNVGRKIVRDRFAQALERDETPEFYYS